MNTFEFFFLKHNILIHAKVTAFAVEIAISEERRKINAIFENIPIHPH
jgi:hypothetical protein